MVTLHLDDGNMVALCPVVFYIHAAVELKKGFSVGESEAPNWGPGTWMQLRDGSLLGGGVARGQEWRI